MSNIFTYFSILYFQGSISGNLAKRVIAKHTLRCWPAFACVSSQSVFDIIRKSVEFSYNRFGCQKVWISLADQFLQSCTSISITDAPHCLKILLHNLEKICSAMKMDLLTPESYDTKTLRENAQGLPQRSEGTQTQRKLSLESDAFTVCAIALSSKKPR